MKQTYHPHKAIAPLLFSILALSFSQLETNAAYSDEVLADSPLVYYRVEELSGDVAQNLGTLGTAANGTYTGGVRFGDPSATVLLGQSIWLDGETGFVAVPELGGADFGQFTVEMWLQRTYDWPGLTAIFANDGWASGFLHLNLVSTETEPLVEFAVNGNNPQIRFFPEWELLEWNHLVITYDTEQSPARARLYFNGVLHSEVTLPTAAPIRITGGRLGSWETQRQFEGNFDEVAFYPTVLSSERIDAHYSEARPELNLVRQPQATTVLSGETATLTVGVTGLNRSYQWFRDDDIIPGATEPQYDLTNAQAADSGARFSVRVSNDLDHILSEEAVLTVISAPEIVMPPVDAHAMESLTATFRVEALGPDLEYQWFKNGDLIGDATDAIYTTPAVTLADEGALFTVRVSNDAGNVTTGAARLSVTALPPDAYGRSVIQDQPLVYYRFEETSGNVVQNLGSLGSSGDGVYPDFGVVHAQPSAFNDLGNAVMLDGMNGYIGLPNLEQPAMSQFTVELWLNRTYDWPGLTALLANDGWANGFLHFNLVTSDSETQVEFAVNGNPAPFPRWLPEWELNEWNYLVVTYDADIQPGQLRFYLNGALLVDQTIAGAIPIRFTGGRIGMWSDARQLEGFVDEFALYDIALAAENVEAHYNTVQTAVNIVAAPVDRTVLWGESAVFQVSASGPDLQYQWFRDGEEISGANGREYVIAVATEEDDGAMFSVRVSNQAGNVTSAAAMLTVVANVTIETQPIDVAVLEGRTARFEITATGSGLQYQWLRDGEEIPGATGPVYAFTAGSADHGALFSVRASNAFDTVTSAEALLSVVTKPSTDYATTILQAAPLVFYRFEESSGASVAENLGSLGFVADGVYSTSGLTLSSDSVTPNLGHAAAFDSGHVEVPDLGLGPLAQVSIEFWLNILADPAPNGFSALWANHGWEPNLLHFNVWGGPAVGGSMMEFAVNGNPGSTPRWAPAQTETWAHWVVTYDVQSEMPELRVYRNGELVLVQPGLSSPILFAGGRIGMWGDTRPLHGLLDEFAIYGTVLTHEEVLQHFAAADVPDAPDAVELQISQVSASEVEISWIGSGFVLESTTDLAAPESWMAFPDGDTSPVIVDIQDDQSFFRLQRSE